MKIFVAGATGVVGRRAVEQLVACGAEVTGVARSREKADRLQAIGAIPVQVSLFDRAALSAAVAGHEVVCNLATSVPTGERSSSRDAWRDNHRIRREGARNLVDAARPTSPAPSPRSLLRRRDSAPSILPDPARTIWSIWHDAHSPGAASS